MTEVSDRNFGFLIAYLLPGFVGLLTLAQYSPTVRSWLAASPASPSESPTVGGFLHVTLASVAVGLTISAMRWLVLDFIHHHTGVPKPDWDFSALQANLAAFEGAVQNHYRYYQFYGNMLVALLLASVAHRSSLGILVSEPGLSPVAVLVLAALFFVASRDALQKYYARTSVLLTTVQSAVPKTEGDER